MVLRAFILTVMACALSACNGSSSSAPAPTPTPTAGPGPVSASPDPLSLTVAAGPNHTQTLTVVQAGATGDTFAITTTCTGGTTNYVTGPARVQQNITGTALSAILTGITGAVAGTCTFTFTPPSGNALTVNVTVT